MYKELFRNLNQGAFPVCTGQLVGIPIDGNQLVDKVPFEIQTLSQPKDEWAQTVDGIETPFAPVYNSEEYLANPALTAMGQFELMEMLRAYGVPRKLQTDYQAQFLSNKRFIVAGCGPGREVVALSALGAQVDAFDATKQYVEITAQQVQKAGNQLQRKLSINLYQALAEEFPYSRFPAIDGISCLFGVINHVQKWEKTLKLMSAGFKQNGVLVIEKYGPNSALIFREVEKGLPFRPSILQRRDPKGGGILLGDSEEVLPAVFPTDAEFSQILNGAGFEIQKRIGYLRLAALYPKTPSEENLKMFITWINQIDPKAGQFIGRFSSPVDILYAAMLVDQKSIKQVNPDDYAYMMYVCKKI